MAAEDRRGLGTQLVPLWLETFGLESPDTTGGLKDLRRVLRQLRFDFQEGTLFDVVLDIRNDLARKVYDEGAEDTATVIGYINTEILLHAFMAGRDPDSLDMEEAVFRKDEIVDHLLSRAKNLASTAEHSISQTLSEGEYDEDEDRYKKSVEVQVHGIRALYSQASASDRQLLDAAWDKAKQTHNF